MLELLKYSEGNLYPNHNFDPITLALIGTAATAATGTTAAAAATAGLIGAGGVVTAGGIASGLGLVASGLGGLVAIQQGNVASNAAKANARIADNNAETTRQQTAVAVDKQDRERRLRTGSAIAGAGASGVGVQSFGDVLSSSAAQEELDLLTLKSEGLLKENDFLTDASLSRSKAKNAKTQGKLKAASSVLGGTSNFMSKAA